MLYLVFTKSEMTKLIIKIDNDINGETKKIKVLCIDKDNKLNRKDRTIFPVLLENISLYWYDG